MILKYHERSDDIMLFTDMLFTQSVVIPPLLLKYNELFDTIWTAHLAITNTGWHAHTWKYSMYMHTGLF